MPARSARGPHTSSVHVLADRKEPDMIDDRLPAIPIRPRITRAPHHISRRPIHVLAMGWVEPPLLVGWVERPREAHRRASASATSARQPLGQLVGWVERPREAHRRASAPAPSARQPLGTRRVGHPPPPRPSSIVQQLPQLFPLRRVNDIIGIEPEGIIPRGPRQRRIQAAAKSSTQTKSNTQPRTRGQSPACGPLIRINDHDLVEQSGYI